MKEVYIHIGIPKTGTSWLQSRVFPYMNLNYIREPNIFGSNFAITGKQKEGINLISGEGLYGSIYLTRRKEENTEILRKLKRLYPHAKIIVCFRKKDEWLKSLYNQFRKNINRSSLVDSFDDWYNNYFDHTALDFEGYKKILTDLFDDILILEFEDLKKDSDVFVKKICDFIGVDVPDYDKSRTNISWKDKHYKFQKLLSMLPLKKYTGFLFMNITRRLLE